MKGFRNSSAHGCHLAHKVIHPLGKLGWHPSHALKYGCLFRHPYVSALCRTVRPHYTNSNNIIRTSNVGYAKETSPSSTKLIPTSVRDHAIGCMRPLSSHQKPYCHKVALSSQHSVLEWRLQTGAWKRQLCWERHLQTYQCAIVSAAPGDLCVPPDALPSGSCLALQAMRGRVNDECA